MNALAPEPFLTGIRSSLICAYFGFNSITMALRPSRQVIGIEWQQ
jgi:hypothetical protein